MAANTFRIKSSVKIDTSEADKRLKAWKEQQKKQKIDIPLNIDNFDKIEKTLRRLQNLSNKVNTDISKQSLKLEQERIRQESKLAQKELEQRHKNELEIAKRKVRDVTELEKANIKEVSKMEQEMYKADKKQAADLVKYKQKLEQDLVKFREKLAKMDVDKLNKENNSKLISEYKDIANTIDKLQGQMNKGIGYDSIERTTKKVEDLKRTYEKLKIEIDEVNRKSFDDKRDNKNLVAMNRELSKLESSADKAITKLNSLDLKNIDSSKIQEINTYLHKLKDVANKDLNLDLDIHLGDAINQVKELDRVISNLNGVDKLVNDFQQIEHSIRDAFGDGVANKLTNELRQLEGLATNLDGSFDRAFNSMNSGMKDVTVGLNKMKSEMNGMDAHIGKFDRIFDFAIGDMVGDVLYDSLYGTISAIGDLDAAITNVKKVANESDINSAMKLDELKNNATDIAIDVGMSVSEVMQATADSIQAGVADSIEGSLKVAEQTMKLANVGELEQGVASSAVNTMINGFDIDPIQKYKKEINGTIHETDQLTESMDYLNYASNNYGTSTLQLIDGMQNGANVLGSYGVGLDQVTGLMTAGVEVLGNGNKVGNGLNFLAC